jgi:hypothetical protein
MPTLGRERTTTEVDYAIFLYTGLIMASPLCQPGSRAQPPSSPEAFQKNLLEYDLAKDSSGFGVDLSIEEPRQRGGTRVIRSCDRQADPKSALKRRSKI